MYRKLVICDDIVIYFLERHDMTFAIHLCILGSFQIVGGRLKSDFV